MGSFRMNKGNLCTACTLARFLINQAYALLFEVCQSSLEVIDAQSDVLDTAAALVLLNEFCNRGFLVRSSQ